MTIRFGILGAGMIARYHAGAVRATPGAELVAVSRTAPARRAEAEAAFGVLCLSPEDLLARPDIDVVAVCTPSGEHAEQIMAAASHGKHVLVEKPMALSLEDADRAIAACHAAGVLLGVTLQRRTDPVFLRVKTALTKGDLGEPTLGIVTIPYWRDAAYYASAAWRGTWRLDGGGALMNQGIHLVDLLVWYLGDPVAVQAEAGTLAHEIEVEDVVAATLRFGNGALGVIAATTAAAPGFPHRVEVYGTKGGVQMEGEDIVRWAVAGQPREEGAGAADAGAGAAPTGIKPEGHQRIVADFVDAIQTGRPPPSSRARKAAAPWRRCWLSIALLV